MLRDRTIQIKLAKDGQPQLNTPAQEPVDITATVNSITSAITDGAVKLVGTYMAADTLRKVITHHLTK